MAISGAITRRASLPAALLASLKNRSGRDDAGQPFSAFRQGHAALRGYRVPQWHGILSR